MFLCFYVVMLLCFSVFLFFCCYVLCFIFLRFYVFMFVSTYLNLHEVLVLVFLFIIRFLCMDCAWNMFYVISMIIFCSDTVCKLLIKSRKMLFDGLVKHIGQVTCCHSDVIIALCVGFNFSALRNAVNTYVKITTNNK